MNVPSGWQNNPEGYQLYIQQSNQAAALRAQSQQQIDHMNKLPSSTGGHGLSPAQTQANYNARYGKIAPNPTGSSSIITGGLVQQGDRFVDVKTGAPFRETLPIQKDPVAERMNSQALPAQMKYEEAPGNIFGLGAIPKTSNGTPYLSGGPGLFAQQPVKGNTTPSSIIPGLNFKIENIEEISDNNKINSSYGITKGIADAGAGVGDWWKKQITDPYSNYVTPRLQKGGPAWSYLGDLAVGTVDLPGQLVKTTAMIPGGVEVIAKNPSIILPALAYGVGSQVAEIQKDPVKYGYNFAVSSALADVSIRGFSKGVSEVSPVWGGVARIPTGEISVKKASIFPDILSTEDRFVTTSGQKFARETVYNSYAMLYAKKPLSGVAEGGTPLIGIDILRTSKGPHHEYIIPAKPKNEVLISAGDSVQTKSIGGFIGREGFLNNAAKEPILMSSGLDTTKPPLTRTDFVAIRPIFKETAKSPIQYDLWEKGYKTIEASKSPLFKPEVRGAIGDQPHMAFTDPAYREMFGVISDRGKNVVTYGSRVLNEVWVGKGYGRKAEPAGTMADIDLSTKRKMLPKLYEDLITTRDANMEMGRDTSNLKDNSFSVQGNPTEAKAFGSHTLEEFSDVADTKLFKVKTAWDQDIYVPGPGYFVAAKSSGAFPTLSKPRGGQMELLTGWRTKDISDAAFISDAIAASHYKPVAIDLGGFFTGRKVMHARNAEAYSGLIKDYVYKDLRNSPRTRETADSVISRFDEADKSILKGINRNPEPGIDLLTGTGTRKGTGTGFRSMMPGLDAVQYITPGDIKSGFNQLYDYRSNIKWSSEGRPILGIPLFTGQPRVSSEIPFEYSTRIIDNLYTPKNTPGNYPYYKPPTKIPSLTTPVTSYYKPPTRVPPITPTVPSFYKPPTKTPPILPPVPPYKPPTRAPPIVPPVPPYKPPTKTPPILPPTIRIPPTITPPKLPPTTTRNPPTIKMPPISPPPPETPNLFPPLWPTPPRKGKKKKQEEDTELHHRTKKHYYPFGEIAPVASSKRFILNDPYHIKARNLNIRIKVI
jgi:hypothetical protein